MSKTQPLHFPEREVPALTWRILGWHVDRAALIAVGSSFVITRLFLFVIVWLSLATFPPRQGDLLYASPDNLLLDGLVRFDSWWYHSIATQGYTLGDAAAGVQGNVAFFPLYPLLVRIAGGLFGNIFLGGVVVSNLALLVLLSYVYAWAKHEFDADTAARAVFYVAAAPTTIFCSALYTESLFLALSAATFYHARRGQWEWAAVAGALAAATRNTGILLAAVIAIEGWQQSGIAWRWQRGQFGVWLRNLPGVVWRAAAAIWPSLLAAAWVGTGLLSYMVFLAVNFGDPLAFIHVQAAWGRSTEAGAIFDLLGRTWRELAVGNLGLGQINTQVLLDVVATLGFLPLVGMVAWRMRYAAGFYVSATFLVPLSTGTTGSMTRYILMLLPCFLLLAYWGRRPTVDRLIVALFLPLSGYMALLFSHWYFAG